MIKPHKTATLEEFVESKTSSFTSYQAFSLVEIINDKTSVPIEFPAYSVLNDYFDEIKALTVDIELSDVEYLKYRYRPKLLSFDLYGNTELGFLILMINDIFSIRDFNLRKLKLIPKTSLSTLLTNIKSAESKFIENYNTAARGDN